MRRDRIIVLETHIFWIKWKFVKLKKEEENRKLKFEISIFCYIELVFIDLNYMFIFSESIAPEIWIGLKSTVPECDTKNKWVQWGQINTMWVHLPKLLSVTETQRTHFKFWSTY